MKKIMKWFGRIFIVIAILVFGFVGYAILTAIRTERPVGFQIIQATDADGHIFIVDVWYPTQAQPGRQHCRAADLSMWRVTPQFQDTICLWW